MGVLMGICAFGRNFDDLQKNKLMPLSVSVRQSVEYKFLSYCEFYNIDYYYLGQHESLPLYYIPNDIYRKFILSVIK